MITFFVSASSYNANKLLVNIHYISSNETQSVGVKLYLLHFRGVPHGTVVRVGGWHVLAALYSTGWLLLGEHGLY